MRHSNEVVARNCKMVRKNSTWRDQANTSKTVYLLWGFQVANIFQPFCCHTVYVNLTNNIFIIGNGSHYILTTLLNWRIGIWNVIEQLNITVISLNVQRNNSRVLRNLSLRKSYNNGCKYMSINNLREVWWCVIYRWYM
jgi:hypothetical protein